MRSSYASRIMSAAMCRGLHAVQYNKETVSVGDEEEEAEGGGGV